MSANILVLILFFGFFICLMLIAGIIGTFDLIGKNKTGKERTNVKELKLSVTSDELISELLPGRNELKHLVKLANIGEVTDDAAEQYITPIIHPILRNNIIMVDSEQNYAHAKNAYMKGYCDALCEFKQYTQDSLLNFIESKEYDAQNKL